MKMGGQTVTVVTFTLGGTADNLGIKAEQFTETDVPDCHFRPLSAAETAQTEFDVATEVWKLTAEPVPAVLAADATGYLKYEGQTFSITGGVQPFTDENGQLFKVTILAQKQTG